MRKTLPAKYYLTHFQEFLHFFTGPSAVLLGTNDNAFIHEFNQLNEDQQCVIVRAANRKHPVIGKTSLAYTEINAPEQQLRGLCEENWFLSLHHASADELKAGLTKEDIIAVLKHCGVEVKSSSKKEVLAHQLALLVDKQSLPDNPIFAQYVLRNFDTVLNYLLFLYFGHTRGRLNQFSLRDLGVMRTRADATNETRRFDTLEEAKNAYFYAQELPLVSRYSQAKLGTIEVEDLPKVTGTTGVELKNQYLFQLGTCLLASAPQQGLQFLALASADNSQEKWCREAYKLGQKDAVKNKLMAIMDDPPSDTLLAFAEDFYGRKYDKKRTSAVTDMLRNASVVLNLDESFRQNVEAGVIAHYRRHNVLAINTENHLWRSLFGLLFWDFLYEQAGMVTEFDRRPIGLNENRFYTDFSEQIEQRLATVLVDPHTLMRFISAQAGKHYGKVNHLFIWQSHLLDGIQLFCDYASMPVLSCFLRMMCQDFRGLCDGFPDIMVVDNGALRFEEIKGPGDQLRRNQLTTIKRLQEAGFDVQITQVHWYIDPLQPYVVIDIETTGGGASQHRITEVGMVKLVGGVEVERWQSLVNPCRHIPHFITQLTGISNEMVADAPTFAQVADSIDAFTKDCVFVAHNVNFDYGFIKYEFERLGQDYRRPKLCTCSQMRKTHPGLAKYSLAALTAHFGITMETHHRALSDALAAAELLKILQQ
jgi:DNA polymerase-3 subunit epsilon